MKKRAMVAVLFILPLLMWATAGQSTSTTAFTVHQQTSSYVELDFNLPTCDFATQQAQNRSFTRITNPDAGYTMVDGQAELPIFGTFVAIPNTGGVQLEVISQDTSTRHLDNPVYPSQGTSCNPQSRSTFLMDEAYYAGNGGTVVTAAISQPMIMRDLRVVNVALYPFAYNPGRSDLTVNNTVRIRLTFNNTRAANEITRSYKSSPSFEPIYKALVCNYDQQHSRYQETDRQQRSIMVLYTTTLDISTQLNNYVNWKRQKGYYVTVHGRSEIGTTTESIKAFIQNAMNTWENPPEYITLIGDGDSGDLNFPTWWHSWDYYNGEGDTPYALLLGDDELPDVFIGRLSASTATELSTEINKVNRYEKQPYMTSPGWFDRSLLVGDTSPTGTSTIAMNKYFKESMLRSNDNATFTEIYGDNPSTTEMDNALNNGAGWFHYRGWIGMSGWTSSNINALTNTNNIFNALIITCSTGSFASGVSNTEAVIRAGTPSTPKGGLNAYGMSTSGTHTTFNNCIDGGMIHGMFAEGLRTIGSICTRGELELFHVYGVSNPEMAYTFSHIGNLMGDPAQEVFLDIPKTFTVNYNAPVAGDNSLDITVLDSATQLPVANAWVTIWKSDNTLLVTDMTDQNGHIVLYYPATITGSVWLTVTADDFAANYTELTLAGSAGSIELATVTVNDDATAPSAGNGNGLLNPGETVEITPAIINNLTAASGNITATLVCTDTNVVINQATCTYSSINPGAAGNPASPLVITLPWNYTDQAELHFSIVFTDGVSSWTRRFEQNVYAPLVQVTAALNPSSANFNPGQDDDLFVTLNNQGAIDITDLTAALRCTDSRITISDSLAAFGTLAVNGSATNNANRFHIHAATQLVPGMIIPMTLALYSQSHIVGVVPFGLNIGTPTINDPLGPDSYGYLIYDSGDTGYDTAPVYSWVGIAPGEEHTGTDTGLNDLGNNQDAVVTVDLPIQFSMYGQTYSQLTIASDGYVTPGVTADFEMRNWRLPGALGPSPMIAAFWDDLQRGNGGVYYWYDSANAQFVVEWYNCQNMYNNAIETFQIILYDRYAYPTSTGDSRIKIQYNTFNNVDVGSHTTHGNYCTVGISDDTSLIGLEYTFNNTYPTAARPITNQSALLITPMPVPLDTAFLMPGSLTMYNADGPADPTPGQSYNMGISLLNMGTVESQGIRVTVSSTDPYVTLQNPTSIYPNISGSSTGYNSDYFVVDVAGNCPDNHQVYLTLTIVTANENKQVSMSFMVRKASLSFDKMSIYDGQGDNDFVADPGESIVIALNFNNPSNFDLHNTIITVASGNTHLALGQMMFMIPVIPANSKYQIAVPATVSAQGTIGETATVTYGVSSDETDYFAGGFDINFGISSYSYDFEDDNGGFVSNSTSGWGWGVPSQTAHSGSKAWETCLAAQYPNNMSYTLDTPAFTLTPGTTLSFWMKYACEGGCDGMNVSLSTNGGTDWTLLNSTDRPYSGNISSMSQNGWYGTSDWVQAHFTLTGSSSNAIIRFHFTSDVSVVDYGFIVDDVTIGGVVVPVGKMTGTVNLINGTSDRLSELAFVKAGQYVTNPVMSDGVYSLYLPANTYNLDAWYPGFESGDIPDLSLANGTVLSGMDFDLHYLPKAANLSAVQNGAQSILHWDVDSLYTGAPRFALQRYDIYKSIGGSPYIVVGSTTEAFYQDSLATTGTYHYMVQAVYDTGSSLVSNICDLVVNDLTSANDQVNARTGIACNYPNPFNPRTTVMFNVAQTGKVNLNVYNVRGQLVKTLVRGTMNQGSHSVVWNGDDNAGHQMASGVYFFRLTDGKTSQVHKAIMLK